MSSATGVSGQTPSHPLVRALAGGPGAAAALQELNGEPVRTPEQQSAEYDAETGFLVLESDAAQRQCVETAAGGHSFVLTGAAGTGKTHTLVNLIADCIARGRTLLCVARQPAGLKDAADRLKQAGLLDFCLALHGEHADKARVVAELARSLGPRPSPPAAPTVDWPRLRACRDGLARYDEALHRVREPLRCTAWSALSELARLEKTPAAPLGLPLRKDAGSDTVVLEEITPTWLDEARQAIQRLAQLWHLRSDKDLVWSGFKAERYTQQVRDEVLALIDKARGRLDRLVEAATRYAGQIGGDDPIPWLLKVGEAVEALPAKVPG